VTARAPDLPRAEPCYFGPSDRPRFGWLHRPAKSAPSRDVGVVICHPMGFELLCSHRSLRHFAETAASLGFPALRFDYDGTGDSAGDEQDADRWEAWRASTADAIRELLRVAPVSRVCLFGVRLGGTLAMLAAMDAREIGGVVLVAPVADGRAWLREMRAVHAAMGRPAAPPTLALPEGFHESAGLLFDEGTRATIAALNLSGINGEPPRECLLIDRADRPPLTRLASRLQELGARVEHKILPGFPEMMLDAHYAEPPAAMLAAFGEWLANRFGSGPPHASSTAPAPSAAGPVTVAPGVVETACFLDEERRLFGVVSAKHGASPTGAVLLLNAGANSRIGTNRLHVKVARRLARLGWLALRYDVSGIGDSLPHPGAPENEVYTPHAVEDFATALDFLRRRFGVTHAEGVGLCSGGYHAFKGAVAGLPVNGLVVVNPLVFFWKPGMSLAYPPYEMARAASEYRRSVFSLVKWQAIFKGKKDLRHIRRVVWHQIHDLVRMSAREVGRALHVPMRDDLAAELQTINRRGVQLRFLFSQGEPGAVLLRVGTGSRLRRLRRRRALSLDSLEGCDHSLSTAWMQEAFWQALERHLGPPR
jgi:pimeloyl-ACP methyl ester carboxylesterase